MCRKQFDSYTNYNGEKGHLLMFREKPGKGSAEKGILLGLNSGSLIILAIWLLKERKGASGTEASFLLKLLFSCIISELQASKKYFSSSVKIL